MFAFTVNKYITVHLTISARKYKPVLETGFVEVAGPVTYVQLLLSSASNPLQCLTHTHIFKLTDASVSAETSFIINLDSGVEWVDVPYSKVSLKVTVVHIVQAGQSILAV